MPVHVQEIIDPDSCTKENHFTHNNNGSKMIEIYMKKQRYKAENNKP
jgi:hypothetical protein